MDVKPRQTMRQVNLAIYVDLHISVLTDSSSHAADMDAIARSDFPCEQASLLIVIKHSPKTVCIYQTRRHLREPCREGPSAHRSEELRW